MPFTAYYFFTSTVGDMLLEILQKADREITSVIGKPKEKDEEKERDITNKRREEEYDYHSCSNISFENDLDLCLDVGAVAYMNEQCGDRNKSSWDALITEFDIRCYFRIPKQQEFKCIDVFKECNNFFSEKTGDYIEIGLYHRIALKEELEAFLEELKACLDGRSSRTAHEIKRMFNDLLVFYDYADEQFNYPFRFQLESILNEFLTCIKNHKSC